MARIVVVDDDAAFRQTLAETLRLGGHEVIEWQSVAEALQGWPDARADLAFVDFRMPDADGLEILRRLKARPPANPTPIVMLTAFASAENTIEAMRLGAFDHLQKPIGRAEVQATVERALRYRGSGIPTGASAATDAADALIGDSAPMRALQKLIGMAAASSANVLLSGESGTGKELVARRLHRSSERADGPFVAINCAAIPADLIESELFGHVRGAFSGAVGDRRGSFREAHGGSLLLDEIGDMPIAMQAKILRVLQERTVTPVGSDKSHVVDVRIVAATHADLVAAVAAGRFRQDLYFRLAVLPIPLPPLRERADDIAGLAHHFLQQSADGHGKTLSDDALRRLRASPWPGNVRELRNVIERVAVLSRGSVIDESDLSFMDVRSALLPAASTSNGVAFDDAVASLERRLIADALAATAGNRTEAAAALGIHRQLLYAKMKQYDLR